MQKDAAKHRSGKVEVVASAGEAEVLALWAGENVWLRHGEIVRRTPKLNKRTLERILQRLVKERVLERRDQGPASYYRKQQAPKEFEAVQYMGDLNSRLPSGMAYDFDVGGMISHVAFGRLVGFPNWKEEELREDEREVLRVLTRRLGFIFQALWLLRNAMLIRRMGTDVPINEEALLTFLFESIADSESRRSERGIRERLSEVKPGTIPEKDVAVLKKNTATSGEEADIEGTADFLLSDGTLDQFLDKVAKAKPKYFELTVPELLKKMAAVRRRENKYVASVQATRKKKPKLQPSFEDLVFGAMIEIPPEVAEEEHEVRVMLAYRVGEALRSRGLRETNELGMVVTAHPWTSSQFADDKQLVYSAVSGLADLLDAKGIVKGTPEFAKEAGEHVAHYHNLDIDSIKALKRKPWFTTFLGSHWRDFTNAFVRERAAMREESDGFLERFRGRRKAAATHDGKIDASAVGA